MTALIILLLGSLLAHPDMDTGFPGVSRLPFPSKGRHSPHHLSLKLSRVPVAPQVVTAKIALL